MILGVDIGMKKSGTALLAEVGSLPYPHKLIRHENNNELIDALIEIIDAKGVTRIVSGLPLGIDGSVNQWCRTIKNTARKLAKIKKVKLSFVDESLSSRDADEILKGKKRKRKAESHDMVAAVLILESYLNGGEIDAD